ncbi:hypothetical protein IKW72_01925 [bacterium]|nr:hypothetical protein [bacterium]
MRNLIIILAALFLCACADKYAVTYVLDPPGNLDLRNKVTVTVRDLIDRRPSQERVGPADPLDGAFYSEDGVLEEPLYVSLTRLLQLELSNAGLDVVDSANYTPGQERSVRVAGEIYHAYVMGVPESPVSDDKLWKRMRYTVRVAVRVDMVDTLQEKRVMARKYEFRDSFVIRHAMQDFEAVKEGKDKNYLEAGDAYCMQLLNDAVKKVLVQARRDIIVQMSPDVGDLPTSIEGLEMTDEL